MVAVVVAHDRRDLLLAGLRALQAQTRRPDRVVVIDNASRDGTAEAVRSGFSDADLLRLPRNIGGAGGFTLGLARALQRHGADWVWLMDDDAEPTPGALAALLQAAHAYPSGPPALVASRVVWHDGRPLAQNNPRPKPGGSRQEWQAARLAGCIPVRSASFVSVLLSADAVRAAGLPVADYFLWNDDFEFTTRLLRGRVGLYCPDSFVVHRTRSFDSPDPGDRFYYEVRNKVWTFTRSPGLRPGERVLYAGATVRRWLRTVQRSPHRRLLLTRARHGLVDGLRDRPRPNAVVLAGLEPQQPEAVPA